MKTPSNAAARGGARPQPQPPAGRPNEFTIEEHLRVQRQIEQLAYCLWRAHQGASAFHDWLRAETVVLAEFVKKVSTKECIL